MEAWNTCRAYNSSAVCQMFNWSFTYLLIYLVTYLLEMNLWMNAADNDIVMWLRSPMPRVEIREKMQDRAEAKTSKPRQDRGRTKLFTALRLLVGETPASKHTSLAFSQQNWHLNVNILLCSLAMGAHPWHNRSINVVLNTGRTKHCAQVVMHCNPVVLMQYNNVSIDFTVNNVQSMHMKHNNENKNNYRERKPRQSTAGKLYLCFLSIEVK